jgi:hypothetical protein
MDAASLLLVSFLVPIFILVRSFQGTVRSCFQIRPTRDSFGPIEERKFRCQFVDATPDKAVSVLPALLCKQG